MKNSAIKRFLALLLCFAMLLPNLTGLAFAAEQRDTETQQFTAQSDSEEKKWVPAVPTDIPAYDGGLVSEELVTECGNGLTQDNAKSYFRMVRETTLEQFNAYLTKLAENQFTKMAENTLPALQAGQNNISTRWLSPKGDYVLTVYYTPDYQEVKIVADTAEDIVKYFSGGFVYESATNETAEVMMTMYGLSMAPHGYDTTSTKTEYDLKMRNCGAMIVIRMPDNSLFINDGGDLQQWSDEVCADFMDFCRKVTGKTEGEKVVINTWFISHAHSDHFEGIPRFFDKYHDQIDIKNVMYSLDDEMTGSTRDMTPVMRMVKAYFPEVKYYKPHTGDKFDICGITFDVIYTQEDRFLPDANNKLKTGKVSSKLREGGTYRDFLQDLKEYPDGGKFDFNDTSTVVKITFPKELTGADRDYDTVLYADTNLADQIIIDTYNPSVLATDIMMVPHHGHDAHPELVAMSGADIFLYTQHKQAIYGPDGDYTTKDAAGTYRPNLRNLFLEMQEQDADGDGKEDLYFNTTAAHKTYWEGNETAVIVFGENKAFAEATALGMARDTEDPTGYSVYTKAAPNFAYEGWTLFSNVIGSDVASVEKVPVTSLTIRGDAVELSSNEVTNDLLISGEKYIIVHDKTNLVLSYSPLTGTEDPARPGSLTAGTRPGVDAGTFDLYFRYASGKTYDDKLYFIPYMRDAILWEFTLDDIFDKYADSDQVKHSGYSPKFGGNAEEYIYRSYWMKGLSSEEVYWYTDPANGDTAWRFLVPGNAGLIRQGSQDPSYNTRIEFFANNATTDVDGDGIIEGCDTCIIYYSDGSNDFRFLTVDNEGNWIQKTYTSVSAAEADLDNLKLRLYKYYVTSTPGHVGCDGPRTFDTIVGMDSEELIGSINYQLTVKDTYRRDIEIPCSGTTPKTGYYWLDGDFSTDTAGSSRILVKYRNDDGTDTEITTLTLNVRKELLVNHEVVSEGLAAAGSSITGNVFESRTDDGIVTDRTMTVVVDTADGYERREVSVNVGMLTYDADTTVTAPGGSAVSAGVEGTLVQTAVEPGTVYDGLTLRYAGMVVSDDFKLTVQTIEELDQPSYPQPGSVLVNKTGTAGGAGFSTSGIANIQLSATGVPVTEGVDMIITLDMSGSMSYAISNQDPDSRLSELKASMKELIKTLQASDIEFRIAISDFGDLDHFMFDDAVADESIREMSFFDVTNGTDWNDADTKFGSFYEYYNHLNYVYTDYNVATYYRHSTVKDSTLPHIIDQATFDQLTAEQKKNYNMNRDQPWTDTITKWNKVHDQYMGSLEPNVYTGSTRVDADAFVSVKDRTYEEWEALIDGFKQGEGYLYGTNYDWGMEYMYRLGYAIQQDNINQGRNREVVAVFMSDGAPMQYNYFSGRTITNAWPDWFTGAIDPNKFQSAAFNKDNKPSKLTQLEALMLEILKTKQHSLANPDALFYRSDDAETRLVNSGVVNADGTAKYEKNSAVRGYPKDATYPGNAKNTVEDDVGWLAWTAMDNGAEAYFFLENDLQTCNSFYSVMARNGILLDTLSFQRICDANGVVIDVKNATQEQITAADQALLEIAKQQQPGALTLRYPTTKNPSRFLYDPDATDLYASVEALLGREITQLDIIQMAYRSADRVDDKEGGDSLGFVVVDGVEYDLQDMIKEIFAEVTTIQDGYEWATLSPYSYFYNAEGKNWWAEAIKGDTDKLYPVINKYAHDESYDGYNGTIRNYYSDGSGAAWNGKDYMGGFRGLDIPIYTLAMSIGDTVLISNEDTVQVLENISSGPSFAYAAYSGEDLSKVFASIASSVAHAATDGYFVDTLGEDYDLQTTIIKNMEPAIEVREYTLNNAHERVGDPIVMERVTFAGNGIAKSSAVFRATVSTDANGNELTVVEYPDIWQDNGLIAAKNFWYNTNVDQTVWLDTDGDKVVDFELAPETFYWKVGNIGVTELVLDYPVVLTGSDSEDPAQIPEIGVYPTNESAKLYYVNYRGHDEIVDTISPEFFWGDSMNVDKKVETQEENFLLTLEAFTFVMESTTTPTVELDQEDVLRDVLSDYMAFIGNTPDEIKAGIKVYTAAFNADGSVVPQNQWIPLSTAGIQLGKTNPSSNRYDIVNITGYDYHTECFSITPRQKDGADYYGSKLIVKIPVKVREGFWGGNNVPTNKDDTAIYDVTGSEETVVSVFPVPHVNVPVKPVIEALDQVVYYGQSGITGKDLLKSITLGGIAIDAQTLTPAEEWMDDYAELNWSADFSNSQTPVSGKEVNAYSFGVVATPKETEVASVGEVVPTEGYTATAVGKVSVLVPVLTFMDSMILSGKHTDAEYYNATNYLGDNLIKWVDMVSPYDSNGKLTDISNTVTLGTEPTLDLTYSREGSFTEDTALDVTVYRDGEVINSVAYFEWTPCSSTLHDEATIPTHKADENQVDFWIHVSSIENDANGLITNKTATPLDNTNTKFRLTLEAYATGKVKEMVATKPADIVLVLDHSGSMRTPVGATKVLKSGTLYGEQYKTDKGQLTKDQLDPAKGQRMGYYVAQSAKYLGWFVMEYNPTTAKWRGYSVPTTESIVNKTGWTEHTMEQDWSYDELPEQLVFYKTQYAMLYESVLSFVKELRESDVAHSVSIVGFAGSTTDGTRVYVGGDETDFKSYDALHHVNTTQARRNELYVKSMKSVAVDQEYEELLTLIDAIHTNDSYTCPAAGLQLANEVLEANKVDASKRDRIVVLFTDGIPNVLIGEEEGNPSTTATQIYDEVVKKAQYTKQTLGAKVYSISTATMGDGDRHFLNYSSSDYPNATGFATPGAAITGAPKYTKEVNAFGDLDLAFGSITNQFTTTEVTLDDTAILVEVLTEYFEFIKNHSDEAEVHVYTQAYKGEGSGDWYDKELINSVKVTVSEIPGSDVNKVAVTGFDYAEEYVSDLPRELKDANGNVINTKYYGKKLVLEVDVKTKDGFWGGDNVATNDVTTGLYPPDSDVPVEIFPVPEVNVPIDVQIQLKTEDKTIYFGGLHTFDGNNGDQLDLTDLLKVTAGGVDVQITPEGFKPAADWMDDYVTIDWTKHTETGADGNVTTVIDSTSFADEISNTKPGDYPFSVTLVNKQTGESSTKTGTSHVNILVPEFTFHDTTVPVGYKPNVSKENFTSGPIWVDIITREQGDATDPNTEPTLTLTYDAPTQIMAETNVQVTITCINPDNTTTDIMGVVLFKWDACGDDINHNDDEDVAKHLGTADSIEFTIHTGTLVEDKVVIDFGLSVEINLLDNDTLLAANSKLVGILREEPVTMPNAFSSTANGAFGNLQMKDADHDITDGSVRYTLTKAMGMQMNTHETFYYVVEYTVGDQAGHYYGMVTIIPATTIYYEDNFVEFDISSTNGVDAGWTPTDSNAKDALSKLQSTDRVGTGNLYGYDSQYVNMAQYSMATAMMVNVYEDTDAAGNVISRKTATATFTFWGTGFDIISLTSNTTGTIMVTVDRLDDDTVQDRYLMVDTYYGYKQNADGQWEICENDPNALYQIPVMKLEDLDYGKYAVEIFVGYGNLFDHGQYGNNSYDFYLDAIRIYNPANNGTGNAIIQGAYTGDGEGWPSYQELRNMLIFAKDFGADGTTPGAVFIDGIGTIGKAAIADYASYGPNNEVYLSNKQAVAFKLNALSVEKGQAMENGTFKPFAEVVDEIHLSMKSVGGTAHVQIINLDDNGKIILDKDIASATDLYYDITVLGNANVLIRNTGEATLSITNFKITYREQPTQAIDLMADEALFSNPNTLNMAMAVLNDVTLPTITPTDASLSLEDEVQYNVYYTVDNPSDIVEMGLILFSQRLEDGTMDDAVEVIPGFVTNGVEYMVSTGGIPAKKMGDILYFKIYAKLSDGSYAYSNVAGYSAATYAKNILNKESASAESKALVVALVNYGAEAQKYFGYNTENLMNSFLTDEQKALAPAYDANRIASPFPADSSKVGSFVATGGFANFGTSVSLEGAFAINYYASVAVDATVTMYYWRLADYNAADVLTAENATGSIIMSGEGELFGAISGIAAKEIEDSVFIAMVYQVDGVQYCTGIRAYSLAAYCKNIAAKDGSAMQALAKAMAVYGSCAKTYFS
ncbi:MAG: hypothetical protein IJV82_05445 [Oscillospiraceae bacterium]|nr:hypothetical protein [Oscillospiraceae bacterium]